MKKRILSLLCVLALCLGLLPITALAATPNGQVIYVGNENVTNGGYWTTDSDGNVTASTAGETPTDNYIHYDAENNVLTLHNATIKNELEFNASIEGGTFISGSAIGVFNKSGNAELTISLVGTNTIANVGKGIFVLASSASTGSSNLTIQGDGSLNASASQTGIWVQSNGNNAALCVENAEVTASPDGAVKNGVLVQAKDGSDVSLTVNGGSLTASVNANISFQFGSGVSGSGTPTVTVSNNAIVRANGGIANNSSTSIQYGTGNEENGGIVFDGSIGTVYGSVTLQDNLEIKSGETLTVPSGASLNCNGKLTNNGTILASGGTVSGNLSDGKEVTTPSISDQPTNQTVTEGSNVKFSVTASDAQTYQWQQSTDNGSSWANIESATSAKYTTEATTTSMSGNQYRCVVKSASGVGVISSAATLTVNKSVSPTSYSISANVAPTGAGTVTVNDSGTSATVEANNAVNLAATANSGYRFTGWTSSGGGTFGNASSAETTFTMPVGNVTVTAQFAKVVTGVKLDKETLGLRTGGSATLTAAVQPSDATNQNVTWQSDNANVATVQNGTVTAVGAGETTITVQTQDGNYTATCKVTVTQRSSGSSNTPAEYNLRFDTNGGDAMSTIVKQANTAIDLDKYVPTRDGYKFVGWYADEDLTKPIDEITLTQSTTIYAKWEKIEEEIEEEQEETTEQEETAVSFTDVRESDWFYKAVSYAVENSLMSGMGDGTFSPNTPLQKEMFAIVLWNLEGNPAPKDVAPFLDVTSDKYYADAIAWTSENGIVAGFGDTFGVGVPITREQFAVMLHNYAQYKGYDVSVGEDTNILSYADAFDISDYAYPAMQWACGASVINGMGDGTLAPQGQTTRAEAATMLMNFCENVVK